MTSEIILIFSILIITIVLFAFEVFSVDKISFFLIATLALTGLVSPEEAISGFSNPATITILCLLIIALAMEDNGVISSLAGLLRRLHVLPLLLIVPIFMLITGTISAFINTTAVVIVFIKIISELSKRFKLPESKLLLPVSFAGILGGSCTLMGTSTNLIVNSVAADLGTEPFSFFEFSVYGIIFLCIGIVVVTIGSRWLPKSSVENLEESYELEDFVTATQINEESDLIGKKIKDTFFYLNPEVSILKLTRTGKVINAPGKYMTLKQGDQLMLMCDVETLRQIQEDKNLTILERSEENSKKENSKEIDSEEGEESKNTKEAKDIKEAKDAKEAEEGEDSLRLIELLILPGSNLIGRTLEQLRKSSFKNAIPIAIKKRRNIRNTKERLVRRNIHQISLKPGDRLLVEIDKSDLQSLQEVENVVVLREHEMIKTGSAKRKIISMAILLLVIGLAASGVLSILVSAISGVALLLLTRSLDLSDVYHRVNWEVIFLLAGMIPLGIAISNTGADVFISESLMHLLNGYSHMFSIGSIFLISMLLSSFISNNATAVIMTPIAIAVASGLDLSMKPFILCVLFGANFSFFTPIGYQTNTLIYGMGFYKFRHFLGIGGILSLILWLTGTWLLSGML